MAFLSLMMQRGPWASDPLGGIGRKTPSSLTAQLFACLSSNVAVWPGVVSSLGRVTTSIVHCLHISPGTHAITSPNSLADELDSYGKKEKKI